MFFKFGTIKTLVLCFVVLSIASTAVTQKTSAVQSLSLTTSNQEVLQRIDIQNKREFWFYLRKPQILYYSSKILSDKHSYFIIYKSVIGIFLSISSYNPLTKTASISTMVRLGDQIQLASENSKAVKLDPLIIQMRISNKSYNVEIDKNGKLVVDPQIFDFKDEVRSINDQRIRLIDYFIKHRYWFYIQGAKIVETQIIKNPSMNYVLFVYEHSNGIYLAIGGLTKFYKLEINTFVRLGEKVKKEDRLGSSGSQIAMIDPKVFYLQ